MVGAFAIFATLPIIDMKEMGIGLAAALLPATMKLLGEANWYLPRWLGWLPRLEYEPQPETEAHRAPEAVPRAGAGLAFPP